ncbi:MAG: hypothetical protein A2287_02030 [Candidatus Melainabacteria bacterium RIFOXYA12_FULL_32_12]|nr:MAG: hypothetical protein A2255_09865 [Candidatus Melainabacteria bacterium RIFOXYA2_FULL_32_9]OGI24711.1 MAG: hypothetical protein A2287_02030 [Candidatus Melainabacteria bacterium RIFOXYA12_FULL_32_12]
MKNKQKLRTVIPIAIFGFISFMVINFSNVNVFDNFFLPINKARELYKEAKEYQDNNEFKTAYYTYNKIPSGYIAYDIVLFQQAKCAAALEDEKTAINKLETLLSKYAGSPIENQASYNLGQAYIRVGDYQKAEELFEETIKNHPDSNYAIGSYYYLGQINQDKDKNIAAKYWLKYLSLSPDGRFAIDCIDGISNLKVNLTTEDKKNIGIALFTAQRYKEAHNYLRQISIQDSWYYLAKINAKLGNTQIAKYFLKEGIWKYSNTVTQDEMQDAMLSYVRLASQPAIKSWSEVISTVKNAKDFALFSKAQIIPKSSSLQFYRTIFDNYSEGYYASEALWNLFWDEFSKGNYNQAISLGKKHIDKYTNTLASPKIIFWTGKAYERIGQKNLAKDYYQKLLSLYPDSYYAFRANGRIQALIAGKDPGWGTNINSSISEQDPFSLPYSYNHIYQKQGAQIAELINIGDYETTINIMKDDPFLDSWIKLKSNLVSKSIVLARDGMNKLMPKPDSRDRRWRLIYPVYYAEEINHYAHMNNLDPILILSLTKEESYFNPLAVSSSNAQGLMQLLPGTAKDIARWNHLGAVNAFQLFDPKANVKLGTSYFKYVKSRLNNSSLYAVAGYNGGPGAVEKWLRTIPHDDLDQFIENIPYEQTRNYIKKVYGSYWNYKRIYNFN